MGYKHGSQSHMVIANKRCIDIRFLSEQRAYTALTTLYRPGPVPFDHERRRYWQAELHPRLFPTGLALARLPPGKGTGDQTNLVPALFEQMPDSLEQRIA
jgi:hypothetical protein